MKTYWTTFLIKTDIDNKKGQIEVYSINKPKTRYRKYFYKIDNKTGNINFVGGYAAKFFPDDKEFKSLTI